MRVVPIVVAVLLLGACGDGHVETPGGDRVFRSEKGDHVLRIEHMVQEGPTEDLPAATVNIGMVFDLSESVFLDQASPLRRAVLPDGQDIPPNLSHSFVDSIGGRLAITRLHLGTERSLLTLLEVRCLLVKVTKWKDLEFGELGVGRSDLLPCGPFQLRVEGSETEVRVSAGVFGEHAEDFEAYREKVPLDFIDSRFAVEKLVVRDANGSVLEAAVTGGGGGEAFRTFKDAAGTPVAYPVTVSIRVPLEYETEDVLFRIKDLPLPPIEK